MDQEPILDQIESPAQLRALGEARLLRLAQEMRQKIIDTVSRHGGHLASNLGVIELTIALHHVFDFSRDRLLWDVGHQCYAHKLLTGRAKRFETLRQAGGLSGFPSPAESPYDPFFTGHAGTAISTAAGLAWASKFRPSGAQAGEEAEPRIVAVVGDAGIVNGLSFEGINNVALLKRQFLIVLNDNSMAIDRTRGALARAFDRIRMTATYSELKHSTESMLQRIPLGEEISEALRHLKDGLKSTIHGGQIFEALGIPYFGPVDGHDLPQLIRVLRALAGIDQPALLHVHTQKGRGCRYAMADPCRFHSPAAYSHQGDKAVIHPGKQPTWTQAFSEILVGLAGENDKIVAITAAMPDGTGLVEFREIFPDRYMDVGMNEAHAVAMAAGLAKAGLRPVVAIYSTFMQRAFDQVCQEVALQELPVLFCMDRAGLVGSDGAVHHGFADIAYLRPLPGVVLMAPADGAELKAAMELGLSLNGPAAIRYPRDAVPDPLPGPCPPYRLGEARRVRAGSDGAILAYGVMVQQALVAADILRDRRGLEVGVVSARFAKPIDRELTSQLVACGRPLLVCEDHSAIGGFGSAVMELAAALGLSATNVRLVGMPDEFIPHATREQQLAQAGLDAEGLAKSFERMIGPAGSVETGKYISTGAQATVSTSHPHRSKTGSGASGPRRMR